ncbi:MAG TPA: phosphatase PAP2 family protein, partial [Azonexus sp.]|nr:phosphatase PAP2 family protein [Azonexus sp.]
GSLRRVDWLPPRNARLVIFGMLLIPLVTVALKRLTNRHCPWDILDFGGYAPYVSLFASTPESIVHGVCFPSGHASGGFVWLIWGLALRATMPALAERMLQAALVIGTTMGLARLVQGAHFISHVLWSAWLAWALAIALATVLRTPVVARA